MAGSGQAAPTRPGGTLQRGHRGGAILQHRSIWRLQLPLHRLGLGLLIALGFTGGLLLLQMPLSAFWGWQVLAWLQGLGLAGPVPAADLALPGSADFGLLDLPVVALDLAMADLGNVGLAAHALACVVLWVGAGWLPDPAKPGAYVLRFAVLIHAASVLYFSLWPGSFVHSLGGHVNAGLRQAWMLMLITPWLHLCTYYPFPFPWWQRLALTGLTLLYLLLLAPLQYTTHAVLLVRAGPVLMPLLHLLFGVMVPILGMVALYGWGMSWHDPLRETGVRHAR